MMTIGASSAMSKRTLAFGCQPSLAKREPVVLTISIVGTRSRMVMPQLAALRRRRKALWGAGATDHDPSVRSGNRLIR